MRIDEPVSGTDVVTLSGRIAAEDLDPLRGALVAAADAFDPATDLIVDVHGVTAFDDVCIAALVAARSRAKWNRRSIAVVGAVGSPVEVALRRSGHLLRIPVHPDVESARAALGRRAAA